MRFGTAYLESIYESPLKYKRLIDKIADQLMALKKKKSFGAVAFRGSSGAALAYPLSAQLNIPIICVRKSNESSHGLSIEGTQRNIKRYVIIDDFMESGKTIKAILAAIDKKKDWTADGKAECVGIVLYTVAQEGEWNRKFFTFKKKKIPIHYWG
ncbi:hypothetical protein LCGC14_1039230 [marine sediment metagenome]|uniref:PRTase-CE domain-containing protein n=1 Tax=marine sediment metagenome TaxID=412755 RepID=A0A0F9MS97_9ZZZZ